MRPHFVALLLVFACAIPALDAQQPRIVKRKLGPAVNGPKREMGPIVSPDGSVLYFGREGYPEDAEREQSDAQALSKKMADATALDIETLKKAGLSPDQIKKLQADLEAAKQQMDKMAAGGVKVAHDTQTYQHIWMSRRQPDGGWGPAELMKPPLNQSGVPSAIYAALPDNNTLLVGGTFGNLAAQTAMLSGEPGVNFIAAVTTRTASGWSQPKHLKIEGFDTTAPRNDFFLAPGGRVLILSLQNTESLGSRDLYVSTLKDDGSWTKPKNLGAPVNSPNHEGGQFIAPDGVTMYFGSNRPGGAGGYDIWVTRRLDDTWLKWSPPENAGPDINTPEAETALSVDASGKLAFLASGKLLEEDLYEFTMPEPVKPKPIVFVRGKVRDPDGTPVPASIMYERLRDGTGAGLANANPADGRYQIALPIGEDYSFLGSASGYYAVSERLDLRAAKASDIVERDLTLIPMKSRAPIRLNNVFFETDKAVLLPESRRELDRLVKLLKDNPSMAIEIGGHTDSQSDDAYNLKLSDARARAVTDYLVKAGIDATRLQAKGYGETRPVGPNTTEEGRALNRRVEFTILKM